MKRFLSILYTLATVLIIVGALFILQSESYGIAMLTSGLGLNILYRVFTLNVQNLKEFKLPDIFKVIGILIMIFACILIFTNSEQKFNMMILAVVLDVIINYKEISLKTK
ncbi:hypothetical protein [Marinifilum caeruleilacunae]|uniref:ATP synthase subunit I n=1 Tax=Marinifilum caeruleilacunae TaxID=2499076 RepID=A0ABX1WZL5_9BACT|nr:hypothetical protein [Marinifilum caeruleilacunae]NOU61572.1 hypothetical protein [Marinifilum caeruleilacunae]